MDKLQLLANALDYIENHLTCSFKTEEIAKHCYCSKSSIEKLFKNMNHISVHDYVVRRKMVIAARLIRSNPDLTLLDLALLLGYQSNESFARAFKQVWNCNPSEYTSSYQFTELYPRFSSIPLEGALEMKKNVDITELYDLFRERKDCYVVCADIKSLVPINEISHKAGDLAILESMKRLSEAAGENDVVFRIGGDEFAVLTDCGDQQEVEKLVARIKSKNGQCFPYEEQQIPLSLHVSSTKFEKSNLKYNELFTKLHETLDLSKIE